MLRRNVPNICVSEEKTSLGMVQAPRKRLGEIEKTHHRELVLVP
jgi:hypothetical protein